MKFFKASMYMRKGVVIINPGDRGGRDLKICSKASVGRFHMP